MGHICVYIKSAALGLSQYENCHFENKAKLLSVELLVLNRIRRKCYIRQ